jgi:hypothetical protein
MNITAAIAILAIHFIADFIVQTRWQATNKSKRLDALTQHVTTYTLCLLATWAFVAAGVHAEPIAKWALLNGLLHFATDYLTSRRTAANWNNGAPGKAFWVWLGFDQFIHAATLLGTWAWLTTPPPP